MASGDTAEQCTRCSIENWGHFVPGFRRTNSNILRFVQHVAGTNFCHRIWNKHNFVAQFSDHFVVRNNSVYVLRC